MKYLFSFEKLGTIIEIIIIDDDSKKDMINSHISFLDNYIDSFENEFSRFIDSSKISNINKFKKLRVSDTFLDIFNKSLLLFRFTNGYFNPLLNLKNIGYSNSFDKSVFEIKNELENLDLEEVLANGNEIVLKDNQNLDFGGIGKGYLVDELVKKLESFGYKDFLVNAGGDLYVKGLNNDGNKWVVGIENPYKTGYIGTIGLSNISVSTSGSHKRQWQIDGKNYHHIINPKTLENETSLISITIISSKGFITDSLATAIFCMGMDNGKDFMIKNSIDGILFGRNKNIFLTPNFKQKYSFTEM